MKTSNSDRRRLLAIAFFIFILFALLTLQFYHIQIQEGDKWSALGDRQHFFIVGEPFARGTFYANNSIKKAHPETPQRLALDIEKYHLYIDPLALPEKRKQEMSDALITMLQIPLEEEAAFREQFFKKSHSRKIKPWLDLELRNVLLEWWQDFAKHYKIPRNALYFASDYQRTYPFGKLLGQVLHTVQNQKDERTDQAVPTGGLELYFNKYLQGKPGKRRLLRSPRNSIETGQVISTPENGADIYLTVNCVLQAIVEEELERGVKKYKALAGSAILMDPKNGEILALAQYPFFFPQDYQSYFNDPLKIEHTKIKSITDAYEPGSVMKPITLAIALMANEELKERGEKPLFDPEEKMPTSNGKFPGRSKPISDTRLHYYLNMDMAVRHSSNIYVSRLVERIIERLGAPWYRSKLQFFGFGRRTGIELPSESPGLLPAFGKKYPNGHFEWSISTPFSLAFGHNLLANGLQIVRAYALFANGGHFVKPTLVRKIVRKNAEGEEELIYQRPVEKGQESQIPKEILERLIQSMKYTTKPGGTCRRGDIWGYTEVGKSSTAKKIVNGVYSERRYVPGFVGFAPVKDPAFVMMIYLDEPDYGYIQGIGKNHNGGACCAPIFRDIAKRCLEYLGVEPDDPYGYPVGDPRYRKELADWIMETQKLQEMYEKWNNKTTDSHAKK